MTPKAVTASPMFGIRNDRKSPLILFRNGGVEFANTRGEKDATWRLEKSVPASASAE